MKCPKCSFDNRQGVRFCEHCGQPLPAPAAAAKPPRREVADGSACPSCGRANRPDVKFCEQCGAALAAGASIGSSVRCPSCGHPNPSGSRFCEECGTRLKAGRRGQPRRLRPWAIAGIALLVVGLIAGAAALVINVIPPITRAEAMEISSTLIQTDYPGLGNASPVVETSRSEGILTYRIEYQTDTGKLIYVVNAETGDTLLLGVR